MHAEGIIRVKRDGGVLDRSAIEFFITGFLDGRIPDYQMTALLMAVAIRGMTPGETADLTRCMLESGEVIDYPGQPGLKVDKHSTGGVGDLISIPLAPLVAAAGVPVPMISGRGLGHTGGTLDKLESIPGFRTDLAVDRFREILGSVGCVMGGQTGRLAPADRRMYALRDVTATVESIPLIVSSILSKKAAEGIDALVLDVKWGRGAFMGTYEEALALARELTRVGTLLGPETVAFVSDMDQPLGRAFGNAVEVQAAIECLCGEGTADLMDLVRTLGTAMLCLGREGSDWPENRGRLDAALEDGRGLATFRELILAQGGDAGVVDHPDRWAEPPARVSVRAGTSGVVEDVNPRPFGEAVVELGGGRRRAEDPIDPSVGVLLHKIRGETVEAGEPLATVLARSEAEGERVGRELLGPAVRIGRERTGAAPRIRTLVTSEGTRDWNGHRAWAAARGK